MKHLNKFNEAKKTKEVDPIEKLDQLFFDFIEELSQAGTTAKYEQKSSNYRSDNKEEVDSAIKEYDELLSKVNDKFEKFKSAVTQYHKK